MNINELGQLAHQTNINNGWDVFQHNSWPFIDNDKQNKQDKVRFLCTHMALVHSEVSEATEAIRKYDKDNFEEELADIAIRVASIAYGLGVNLDERMRTKIAKNAKRGLHHGGKAV